MQISTSGTCTSASNLPYVIVAATAFTPAPPVPSSALVGVRVRCGVRRRVRFSGDPSLAGAFLHKLVFNVCCVVACKEGRQLSLLRGGVVIDGTRAMDDIRVSAAAACAVVAMLGGTVLVELSVAIA